MIQGRKLPLLAALALWGCQGDSSQAPAANLAAPVASAALKKGPTPAELTAGMVEAVTIGKSSAPVGVKFDVPHRPTVGVAAEVVIAVMPEVAARSAVVQANGSEGLRVAPAPVRLESLDPTQVYRVTIPIMPTAEGLQLLGLSVDLKLDEPSEARVFSVPVLVSAAPAAAPGTAVSAAGAVTKR